MVDSYTENALLPKMETVSHSFEALLLSSAHYSPLLKKYNNFFNSIFRLKVVAFGYEQLSPQGDYLGFSNEPKLAELFVEAKAYEDPFILVLDNKTFSNCGFIEITSHWGLNYYEFRTQMKNQLGIDLSFYVVEKRENHHEIFVWNYELTPQLADQRESLKQIILLDYVNHYEVIQCCLKELKKELTPAILESIGQIQLPNMHFVQPGPTTTPGSLLIPTPFLSEEEAYLAHTRLSSKEKLTLDYYIQGMTAKEIGKKMKLSARTIESHILNLKYKLRANSRSDMIEKAKKISLLDKYR